MRVPKTLPAALLVAFAGAAAAKLPPLAPEAKAKADEAAARTAWTTKVSDFQLCKSMDKVAATYAARQKQQGKEVKPTATPACTDPGAFVYTPPSEKPLEASGARASPNSPNSRRSSRRGETGITGA